MISKNYKIKDDLSNIVTSCNNLFSDMSGSEIFLTGGTGFIGKWILETIKFVNESYDYDIKITILTRKSENFKNNHNDLFSHENFSFIDGNILDFTFPKKNFEYIIHAATDASAELNDKNPSLMFDTIVGGTRNMLDMAIKSKPRKFLYLSSGAVYGNQPIEMEKITEDWNGSLCCNDTKATYAEGKRAAEMLCSIYHKQHNINISIARIFALLGPYLTLGIHFAAGNFLLDALNNKKVIVSGNGLPVRSYLYSSDLMIFLFHLLLKEEKGINPYNIGSSESISIKTLAEKISNLIGNGEIEILDHNDKGWNLGRYVPDTDKFSNDFNIKRKVSLDESIIRTALWNGWKK